MLAKSQPNFQHYVNKIEAQGKKWFSFKKKRVFVAQIYTFRSKII